mgnify:CR=1 FL=1|jgi:hypothetical protein
MGEVFLLWRLITPKVTETGAQDGGHIMTVRVIGETFGNIRRT